MSLPQDLKQLADTLSHTSTGCLGLRSTDSFMSGVNLWLCSQVFLAGKIVPTLVHGPWLCFRTPLI